MNNNTLAVKQTYLLFLLALIFISFLSCEENNLVERDLIETEPTIINYSGENDASPLLPPDEYEAAAKFTTDMLANCQGKTIKEVEFYLVNIPELTEVRIYSENNNSKTLLYAEDVTKYLQENTWNKHIVSTPIEVTGDALWVSIYLKHTEEQYSIGCDPGPRNDNGDWLLSKSMGDDWSSFYELSEGASINWNIRAVLSE